LRSELATVVGDEQDFSSDKDVSDRVCKSDAENRRIIRLSKSAKLKKETENKSGKVGFHTSLCFRAKDRGVDQIMWIDVRERTQLNAKTEA
jgi:hypothetical protein